MAVAIQAEITGIRELQIRFDAFSTGVRNRVLRQAVQAGVQIVAKAVKQEAKRIQRSGQLWRSIGSKVVMFRGRTAVGIVGARQGFGIEKVLPGRHKPIRVNPFFYFHLVEGGTKPHALGKGSQRARGKKIQAGRMHPGAKAQPILHQAWNSSRSAAAAAVEARLASGIEREARKAAMAA